MAKRLTYNNFRPIAPGDIGYTPAKRKARNYYSPITGEIISVRQFQERAKGIAKRDIREETLQKYYRVYGRVRDGESLSSAIKAEHTTYQTINKINEEKTPTYMYQPRLGEPIEKGGVPRRLLYLPPRKSEPGYNPQVLPGVGSHDSSPIVLVTYNKAGNFTIEQFELRSINVDKINSSELGRYWKAVNDLVTASSSNVDVEDYMEKINSFANTAIYDINGNRYTLLTGNDLMAYLETLESNTRGGIDMGEIWKLFDSDKRVKAA